MKHIKLFITIFASVWLIGCQQSTKENQTEETITDSLPESSYENISSTDTTGTIDTMSSSGSSQDSLVSQPADNSQKFIIREGTHNLSLQWISWEEMGKAEIRYLGGNTYSIEGEQRSSTNSDYLKIKGTLEPASEKELIFDGTVEHQIATLNQGQPCVKKGKQTFLSTKNRKYWRMQDMQNCEGGMVTDYVDIYF